MAIEAGAGRILSRTSAFARDLISAHPRLLGSLGDDVVVSQEVARGYLLIFVFYTHAMLGVAAHLGTNAWYVLFQLKYLVPGISAFFLLSGMSAPNMARKGYEPILRRSFSLLLFAIVSHLGGFLIMLAGHLYDPPYAAAKALVRPLVYGIDYEGFIGWFFLTLAIARLFAYQFLRSWPVFLAIAAGLACLVWFGKRLGLPDNIYEWRNWPAATLFFLIGMHWPRGWRIPHLIGVPAMVLSVLLALVNRHGLFHFGPCLTCDMRFQSEAMIGKYGSILVYIPQQMLFALFLVWFAQRTAPTLIGRTARFFGRSSLPILLMHGWVLLTIYPGILSGMPSYETPYLFVGILCTAIVVHAVLYSLLSRPLDWIQAQIFVFSRIGSGRGLPSARRARAA